MAFRQTTLGLPCGGTLHWQPGRFAQQARPMSHPSTLHEVRWFISRGSLDPRPALYQGARPQQGAVIQRVQAYPEVKNLYSYKTGLVDRYERNICESFAYAFAMLAGLAIILGEIFYVVIALD